MRLIASDDLRRMLPCDLWLDSTQQQRNADVTVRGYRFEPSASQFTFQEHVLIVHRQQRAAMQRTYAGQVHATVVEAGDITLKNCDSGGGPWEWQDTLDVLHIYLRPALLDRVAAEMYGPAFGSFRLNDSMKTRDPELLGLVGTLADEFCSSQPGAPLMVRSLSQQLAVMLVRRHGEVLRNVASGGFSAAESRRISTHIADNLTGDLAVGTLAEFAGLSTDHFSKLFRATFGCAPHQYVLKTRVERASRMLRDPDLSMADIAAETGFSDQSHLSRHFKREFGQSPGLWRIEALAALH